MLPCIIRHAYVAVKRLNVLLYIAEGYFYFYEIMDPTKDHIFALGVQRSASAPEKLMHHPPNRFFMKEVNLFSRLK